MPDCVGLEYEAALLAMVDAGVRVIPLGYFQDDPVSLAFLDFGADPGVVFRQFPYPGSTISANSPVNLTCSQFKVAIAYPNLFNDQNSLNSSIPGIFIPGFAIPSEV